MLIQFFAKTPFGNTGLPIFKMYLGKFLAIIRNSPKFSLVINIVVTFSKPGRTIRNIHNFKTGVFLGFEFFLFYPRRLFLLLDILCKVQQQIKFPGKHPHQVSHNALRDSQQYCCDISLLKCH